MNFEKTYKLMMDDSISKDVKEELYKHNQDLKNIRLQLENYEEDLSNRIDERSNQTQENIDKLEKQLVTAETELQDYIDSNINQLENIYIDKNIRQLENIFVDVVPRLWERIENLEKQLAVTESELQDYIDRNINQVLDRVGDTSNSPLPNTDSSDLDLTLLDDDVLMMALLRNLSTSYDSEDTSY